MDDGSKAEGDISQKIPVHLSEKNPKLPQKSPKIEIPDIPNPVRPLQEWIEGEGYWGCCLDRLLNFMG